MFGYCERLASHDTALRTAAAIPEWLYSTPAWADADVVMRQYSGVLVTRAGADVDELADVLVRAIVIGVISSAAAVVLTAFLLVGGGGAMAGRRSRECGERPPYNIIRLAMGRS